MTGDQPAYGVGDRVECIGRPEFDGIIDTGEVGSVLKVERGWVFARWSRSGVHGVPVTSVRAASPPTARVVGPGEME